MALSSAETRQIKAGVVTFAKDLDRLSTSHYGVSGAELLDSLDTAQGRRQYERLLGVLVKEPFATAVSRPPTATTKARVRLDWKPPRQIEAAYSGKWQGAALHHMTSTNFIAAGGGRAAVKFKSAGKKATKAQHIVAVAATAKTESGLGRKLLNAFHRRICGSAESSQAVKDAIKKAEQEGHRLTDPTVNGISVGAATIVGAAVGTLLTGALAAVAAPVVGGVALLLMQVGVEGFCDWSNEKPKPKPKPSAKPGAKKKKKKKKKTRL